MSNRFTTPLMQLWSRAHLTIITNALSMFGATVVTSGFGVLYWLLAARLFPNADVGFAGASISAMTLLGTAGMLGFGTLLIGELPRLQGQEGQVIAAALLAVSIAGAALGAIFAVAAPLLAPNLGPLSGSTSTALLFALGVSLTSTTTVLDQALIGLLRGSLQFWRNTVFAASKLAALLLAGNYFSDKHWVTIYGTWLSGNVISLAMLTALVVWKRRRITLPRLGASQRHLRQFGSRALGHHWLNLALQLPGFAMPVAVTAVLTSTENAYFYIASMIASLVFFGPLALVTALYAVGARDPEALAQRVHFTMKLAMCAGVAVNLVLFVGASHLLGLFGPAYAAKATWTLRVLGLAVFPVIIKDHYVTISRIRGQILGTAVFATAGAVFELALAATIGLKSGTLWGFALGWLAALCVEATAMAPFVYRSVRRTRQVPVSVSAVAVIGQ